MHDSVHGQEKLELKVEIKNQGSVKVVERTIFSQIEDRAVSNNNISCKEQKLNGVDTKRPWSKKNLIFVTLMKRKKSRWLESA